MAVEPTKKKVVKVNVFADDMPTLTALFEKAGTDKTEEGIHFALKLMDAMLDEILERRKKDEYLNTKIENWRQGRMRSELPFYG